MFDNRIKKIILSAMFLALGIVLPYLTGQIETLGTMLLPMHIPVILCGLINGAIYGFIIGLILPIMRSILCGMPVMYPTAITMCAELAVYGFISGFLYNKNKYKCIKALYKILLISMLIGRITYTIMTIILYGITKTAFTINILFTTLIINAIPGIIIQLTIIPAIMMIFHKTKFKT